MPNRDGLTAVGATHLPDKDAPVAYPEDSKKAKEIRKAQATDERGGPLTAPEVTHPTQTVEDTPAYRRADGSRHTKEG